MENSKQVIEQGVAREVRFAVVMYGGVSLAIYINGIAQELLKMCRATVSARKTEDLKSTEKVYRQISALMANEKLADHLSEMLTHAAKLGDTQENKREREKTESEIARILDELITPDDRPLTKFVVDVLTGTSAGGINAIFLAKALANNQDIAQLKNLWLNEGDIKVLINDKKSVENTGLNIPETKNSLLNSQRMYLKLLEAFEAMGKDGDEESIYTDEIDLFVPTTDFKGVIIPLRLLDNVVEEKKHGQVFRFRYEKGKADGNDFKNNNPMLAFAARSTSSFPFAFEPMRLSQAYSVIEEGFEDFEDKNANLKQNSEKYFPKIIKKDCKPIDWTERDLVDGGVLDNKPFGYAIDVLSARRNDFLCERKLLYVEPSPESFSQNTNNKKNSAPNVLQNAVASLSSIPSYETIREDLERLLDRNKLIERVTELIKRTEKDVFEYLMKNPASLPYELKTGQSWEFLGLEDIVKWKSPAVLPYYHLRIADLTDDIARLVSRIVGIEEDSENYLIIRDFVKAWRDENYSFYRENLIEKQNTVLTFLRKFDMKYRLRRLRFVQEKATLLYRFQADFRNDLKKRKRDFENIKAEKNTVGETEIGQAKLSVKLPGNKTVEVEQSHPFIEDKINVSQDFVEKFDTFQTFSAKSAMKIKKAKRGESVRMRPTEIIWLVSQEIDGDREIGIKKIRITANYFITKLNVIFKKLQSERENIYSKQNQLYNSLSEINFQPENLQGVFEYFEAKNEGKRTEDIKNNQENTDDRENNELKNAFPNVFQKVENAAKELERELKTCFEDSRTEISVLFNDYKSLPAELAENDIEIDLINAVKGYLEHYYTNFDEYDQLSFPVFFETKVGEAVKVDVMRISPQDATSLIDERKEKRQKLGGESLFHFGGFLDRVWRFYDIMWGRLDGVERLITALLPDKKYTELRKFLTKKAHLEILQEEMLASNKAETQNNLIKSLLEKSAGFESQTETSIVTGEFMDEKIQQKVDKILENCLEPESAYKFIKENYTVETRLEPKELLRIISRSTKVTGDIFEGIADKDSQIGSRMRWISRLGTIFWGLVEVAAPNSFWHLIFQHWLMLIYFFEIVLLIGSTIFVKPEVQQFATISLILTLIIHLTAATLGDYMRGGRFLSLIKFVAVGIFAVLTVTGGIFIYSFFYDAEFWGVLNGLQDKFTKQQYYLKLFPVAILITIFAAMLTWRETANVRVRFFGGVSILFVFLSAVLGFVFWLLTKDAGQIDNLRPILSLEFVRTADQIFTVAKELGNSARSGLKWALAIDTFLFVPLYTGFLLIFARLFNLRKWEWKNYFIIAASICILGTALADLSENLFTYSVLDLPKEAIQPWKINGIWISASVKWLLLSVTTAILSLIFWRKNWWIFFTVGFLAASVCGIAGIFRHEFIQKFMILQLSLLLAVGILFLVFPAKFKREFK